MPRLVDSAAAPRAQLAAGEIHSDIQRGFIRAEVVGYDALVSARIDGRLQATPARSASRARSTWCRTATSSTSGTPPSSLAPMAVRTVLVCETQVPLVRGGAELLVRQLVDELRARGFETDRVAVPFKWYPKQEILPHAAAWGLLDLSESNGRPIDLVIATKFPTYVARHPRKVCWLVHQHRAAYELAATAVFRLRP